MQKNWYAVYTKHGCELKTTALLSKKKIEHYCPFQKETLQWNSRKKNNLKPLFPTVIFVKISGHQLPYVKQLSDIINCFYWLGKPAIIKAAEI
ncbi:MAG TPA: UpxY family transcription antiterminator [Ferruginibacter sp.]|nr:UpxY family transcription antiterminator [Ferruginibacter sp.]